MKTIDTDAMTAIEAGEALVTGAVQITPRDPLLDPIRLWGGYGVIQIDGEDYLPLGDKGFAQQNSGAIGGVAQGLTLGVSGIEAAALDLLDADEVKQGSVILYRLIFASDGTELLDAHLFDRGHVDKVDTVETVGGTATINVAIESAARGLGRDGARQRSDSDQRLINATDGYFKFTAYAAEKALYWGGKRPSRAGSALSVNPANFGGAGTESRSL